MESGLKQRLVGAAVLVALAVIFLPMLVQGPAPDSGVSNVPLTMPAAPRGDTETRDLPLVTPGDAPAGGAVGLARAVPADDAVAAPPVSTVPASSPPAAATTSVAVATNVPSAPIAAANAPVATPLPAATAGGDYAVSFGAYASTASADAVIASLRSAQLPAYREPTTSGGKPAWRVRIGPFATRAEAESARLQSAHVRDDVGAQVVVLDAAPASPSAAVTATKSASAAAAKPTTPTPSKPTAPATAPGAASATPVPSKPAASPATVTTVASAPKPPAASGIGFAVQLAAYSKAADATALRDRLRGAGFSAFTESVTTDKGALTRVRVGPVANRADAEQLQAQVKAKLGLDGIVRPHP